jgi:hypothetical protein
VTREDADVDAADFAALGTASEASGAELPAGQGRGAARLTRGGMSSTSRWDG